MYRIFSETILAIVIYQVYLVIENAVLGNGFVFDLNFDLAFFFLLLAIVNFLARKYGYFVETSRAKNQ